MTTCVESPERLNLDLVPRERAWRVMMVLPLALVLPWVLAWRGMAGANEAGTLRALLLVLLLLTATVTDLLRRRIYNWTTYTILGWVVVLELLGVVLGDEKAKLLSLGTLPWRESLGGFAVGFGILFVLYNVFHGGAGDLKLAAVLGALVGIKSILEILVYTYILAGVFAACLLIAVAGPASLVVFMLRALGIGGSFLAPSAGVRDCLKRRLPMAPFIAGGTVLALLLR